MSNENTNPCVLVTFRTNKGNFLVELLNQAPLTVENFLNYVREGHYSETIFHRVIPGFMIQGGNFKVGMQQQSTYNSIANESRVSGLKNERYTISMARTSQPDTATDQFFINVNDNHFLDATEHNAGYAVFGRVIEGQDVIDSIALVRTGNYHLHQDVPKESVIIHSVSVGDYRQDEDADQQAPECEDERIPDLEAGQAFDLPNHFGYTNLTDFDNLKVTVQDNVAENGANHRFKISGFNTATNPSEDQVGAALELDVLFHQYSQIGTSHNGVTPEALLFVLDLHLNGLMSRDDNPDLLDAWRLVRRAQDELKSYRSGISKKEKTIVNSAPMKIELGIRDNSPLSN